MKYQMFTHFMGWAKRKKLIKTTKHIKPMKPMKPMKQIVYKIVFCEFCETNSKSDNHKRITYVSSTDLPKQLKLTYSINKTTYPKIGKIFTFNTINNAKKYITPYILFIFFV